MGITPNISIGENKRIVWVELNEEETPFELDGFLSTTQTFWKLLETECVSACCGIDAFSLWQSNIENANKVLNNPNIKTEFEKLRLQVSQRHEKVVVSSYLNQLFDKDVFLQVIDYIVSCL